MPRVPSFGTIRLSPEDDMTEISFFWNIKGPKGPMNPKLPHHYHSPFSQFTIRTSHKPSNMHFPSLATIIALTAATVAEASKFNLEIGYFSILVPPIGGNIPGIGCGPWGRVTGSDGSTTKSISGLKGNDECPSAEIYNYCQRFGCPQTWKVDNVLAFEIQSGSGKNLRVKGTKLNGKTQTVTCGSSYVSEPNRNGGRDYRTNICYFDL
ncbi:hypothetical protein FGRA07_11769 [Fusarium graminearum]|nr:hypothetical protein FGRA07_11769 [Fusarium graminearum]